MATSLHAMLPISTNAAVQDSHGDISDIYMSSSMAEMPQGINVEVRLKLGLDFIKLRNNHLS
jgi:hypothetical protein